MAIRKLPNGKWEASYRDPAGRERIKRHSTRAEADRWLATVKASLSRGDYIEPRLAREGFKTWSDEWLETTSHLRATYAPRIRERAEDAHPAGVR